MQGKNIQCKTPQGIKIEFVSNCDKIQMEVLNMEWLYFAK